MSSYSELVKNFERIRAYMREFYVYGFKSREEYGKKSARSYDDERRRIESWLGEHTGFVRTPEGKNVFISIDSRTIKHNPFHKAWKAKSFTDGDITLHFILFDILYTTEIRRTLAEIMEEIDRGYLSDFDEPMVFDESTVRKKLKEYCTLGIISSEKEGRRTLYRRADSPELPDLGEVLHYFSETAPCGVIGSYLLDKSDSDSDFFAFKHHYITSAMDMDILAELFRAMREKRAVTVSNLGRRQDEPKAIALVPLRIFISVQSGRQYLLAYEERYNCIRSFRVDHLSGVKLGEIEPRFDEFRAHLDEMQKHMWGVNTKRPRDNRIAIERVEFTVRVEDNEEYIVRRLLREKRIGSVERLDKHTYRFIADVYDTTEMIPWIRTFICRIVSMHFSNRAAERQFRSDLEEMYRMYGIGEGESE